MIDNHEGSLTVGILCCLTFEALLALMIWAAIHAWRWL